MKRNLVMLLIPLFLITLISSGCKQQEQPINKQINPLGKEAKTQSKVTGLMPSQDGVIAIVNGKTVQPNQERDTNPKFKVTGLMPSPSGGIAIVNGKTVQPGQKIEGYTVVKISSNNIELEKNGEKVICSIKAGPEIEKKGRLIWKTCGLYPPTTTLVILEDINNSSITIEGITALWGPINNADGTTTLCLLFKKFYKSFIYSSHRQAMEDCKKITLELDKRTKWELEASEKLSQQEKARFAKSWEEHEKRMEKLNRERKLQRLREEKEKQRRFQEQENARDRRAAEKIQKEKSKQPRIFVPNQGCYY